MKRFYITYFGCNRRQFACSRIRDYFLANEAVQVLGRQDRIRIELIEGLHPVWLLKEEEALVRLAATGRIRTLMIPIQSGSPRLLQLMNRNPDVNGFERAISRLRRASGKLRLATQVIFGFPTETEEDFLLTRELLRRCAFDEVDLFQYYETPTTDSAELLPKVPGEITLDRMRRLMLSLPPRTILHTLFGGLQKKSREIGIFSEMSWRRSSNPSPGRLPDSLLGNR